MQYIATESVKPDAPEQNVCNDLLAYSDSESNVVMTSDIRKTPADQMRLESLCYWKRERSPEERSCHSDIPQVVPGCINFYL